MLGTLLLRLREYAANPDPLANAAGTIALIVACNQPFYPLYLHAILGAAAWPAWLTLLSTPFFVAVPALARRHSFVGRAMLPIAGVANTVLCVKLFGAASAVELFLLPCLLLGSILFRPHERIATAPVLALPFIAYLLVDWKFGVAMKVLNCNEYAALITVNAMSVAALTVLIGILFTSILAREA
jgi:hypothetical protein